MAAHLVEGAARGQVDSPAVTPALAYEGVEETAPVREANETGGHVGERFALDAVVERSVGLHRLAHELEDPPAPGRVEHRVERLRCRLLAQHRERVGNHGRSPRRGRWRNRRGGAGLPRREGGVRLEVDGEVRFAGADPGAVLHGRVADGLAVEGGAGVAVAIVQPAHRAVPAELEVDQDIRNVAICSRAADPGGARDRRGRCGRCAACHQARRRPSGP